MSSFVRKQFCLWAEVVRGASEKMVSVLVAICRLFTGACELTVEMIFAASRYRYPFSVNICVCRHTHRTYLNSSSFNQHNHMKRCHVRLKGPSACEATVLHEVQVHCAVQQHCNDSDLGGIDLESYDCISPVIQRSVIQCVLFYIEQFLSQSYLKIVQSGVIGKSLSCFTVTTSTSKRFITTRRSWLRAVNWYKKPPVIYLITTDDWRKRWQ